MTCGGETVVEVGAGLVERTFWRSWRRWPLAVVMDLGMYLHTRAEVSPGKVVRYPVSMDFVQVDIKGLKQARCK